MRYVIIKRWLLIIVTGLILVCNISFAEETIFHVKGRIVLKSGEPVTGQMIQVLLRDEDGNFKYKLAEVKGEDGETYYKFVPGYGDTDDEGRFDIEVDRSYIEQRPIKIGLKHQPQILGQEGTMLKNDLGAVLVVEVSDNTKVIDLEEILGPIQFEYK
jgi:hypothetical protein